jgi:broad specificity phosphatase PhoE
MSKPLILVKHSLPEIEPRRPARDWKLSYEGQQRAEQLAEDLRVYSPEVVFSSPEPKALETAQVIAGMHGRPVYVVDGLQEHERTHVPWLSSQEFESTIEEFFSQPDVLVFGDETANQAYERFSKTVFSLLEEYKDQDILIVAHGTVISLFISRLTGEQEFSLWKNLGLPSFVVLDLQSKRLVAIGNLQENQSRLNRTA